MTCDGMMGGGMLLLWWLFMVLLVVFLAVGIIWMLRSMGVVGAGRVAATARQALDRRRAQP